MAQQRIALAGRTIRSKCVTGKTVANPNLRNSQLPRTFCPLQFASVHCSEAVVTGFMDRRQQHLSLTAVALFFLSSLSRVSSFFSPFVPTNASPTSCALRSSTRFSTAFRTGHGGLRSSCRARARGGLVMERPSGKFNRLAKPAFDRDNPNAVLGEVTVPGLQQVNMRHVCRWRPVLTLVCCRSELAH